MLTSDTPDNCVTFYMKILICCYLFLRWKSKFSCQLSGYAKMINNKIWRNRTFWALVSKYLKAVIITGLTVKGLECNSGKAGIYNIYNVGKTAIYDCIYDCIYDAKADIKIIFIVIPFLRLCYCWKQVIFIFIGTKKWSRF